MLCVENPHSPNQVHHHIASPKQDPPPLYHLHRDKVVQVHGQADVLIVAPSCIGPYTKDCYHNPLLVNTYALGYYFNMYIGGTPLLKQGGVVVVVNDMPYAWESPAHDCYREFFEQVLGTAIGGGGGWGMRILHLVCTFDCRATTSSIATTCNKPLFLCAHIMSHRWWSHMALWMNLKSISSSLWTISA